MALITPINKDQTIGKPLSQVSEEFLLATMADTSCRKLLEATIDSPKTARELSINCEISLGTAYRRLRLLTGNKIIKISGIVRTDGKKVFLYQSRIQAINNHFDDNSMIVEIVLTDLNCDNGTTMV